MAVPAMDDMADRYADRGVSSVFIYTREAHPAENYRHHTSMDVKRSHAKVFREQCNVRRRILLDDLEGSAHRAFGSLPNMTYIIGRGMILYRASWTDAADIEDALESSLDALARRGDDKLTTVFSERLAWRKDVSEAFRKGLERNGPQAVSDFSKR
jgi:hypothetical protein